MTGPQGSIYEPLLVFKKVSGSKGVLLKGLTRSHNILWGSLVCVLDHGVSLGHVGLGLGPTLEVLLNIMAILYRFRIAYLGQ